MRRLSHRTGFTLIELLVVIAIIAILAAILFPVFARARENARKSTCQSNMKQLALGMLQYVQDYDERFPGSAIAHCHSGAQAYPQDACCLERNIWVLLAQPYLKNRDVTRCPSGEDNWPNRPATPYGAGGVNHYKFKHALCANSTGVKMASLGWPAQQFMFQEYRAWHDTKECACANPANPSAQYNIAFLDGHVKIIRKGDTLYFKRNGRWDPHWFVDPSTGGNTSDPSVGYDM